MSVFICLSARAVCRLGHYVATLQGVIRGCLFPGPDCLLDAHLLEGRDCVSRTLLVRVPLSEVRTGQSRKLSKRQMTVVLGEPSQSMCSRGQETGWELSSKG